MPPQANDQPVHVEIKDGMLRVALKDGREIATPLAWYPHLAAASPEQQAHVELGFSGIYWPDLDEDLSISGMLRGIHAPQVGHDLPKGA